MKKKILICINELYSNSIGISLINLLGRADYTKYDIDLIFVKSQTNVINQLPREVNIIDSPFDVNKINLLYKLKLRHKYDFSLMYDIEDAKLCSLVKLASKNNAIYLHKDYRSIYVVLNTYNEFINSHKVLEFSKIIFSNDLLKDKFNKLHTEVSDKTCTLEYAIDDTRILNLAKTNVGVDKPDYKTLLVSVGTLNDRAKNFTLMIKMMANLVQMNNKVHLWILGDGPDLVNIKMLVKQYRLDGYVTLFGFKNNPYPYMKLADYYLNTSDSFDSSTSLFEARVLQKPIISTGIDNINSNTYIVSSDPNKIATDVNNILINKVKYNGENNFWAENQQVLKKFENIVNN